MFNMLHCNSLPPQWPCTGSPLSTMLQSRVHLGKRPKPPVTRPCFRTARRTLNPNPKPKPPPPSAQRHGGRRDGWHGALGTSENLKRVVRATPRSAACNTNPTRTLYTRMYWCKVGVKEQVWTEEQTSGKPSFIFKDPYPRQPSTFLFNNDQSLGYKSNNSTERWTVT